MALEASEAGKGREGPAPSFGWRIVVDSIGTANFSIMNALRHVLPFSEQQLASIFFQAPAELLRGLTEEVARGLSQALREAGVESRAVNGEVTVVPGDKRHEIALVVSDLSRVMDVVSTIIRIMGVSASKARTIVCASPSILLGQLSLTTANLLKERFRAVGAEVDVSDTETARFDIYRGALSASDRSWVQSCLSGIGIAISENVESPLLVADRSKEEAALIWERLRHRSLPIQVLNRDFQRFDVRLTRAPDTDEMRDYIARITGAPPPVAKKLIKKAPFVLCPYVPFREMQDRLVEMKELGADVSANLITLQRFGLVFSKVRDAVSSARVITTLCEVTDQEAREALRSGRLASLGLSQVQARWMQWELKKAGTECQLITL